MVSAPAAESVVRNRDFVRLWVGETISQLGTQITLLAIPLVAIKTLDATTFQVGALTAAEMLPFLLVGLPAGVLVDRRRRRPMLIATDLGRAAALLSIPLAYELDILSLPQLYVVVFITGVLTVCFDVAYQSYLPALIDRSQLADGNAKLEISRSGAMVAGPGLAGLLVHALKAPLAVFADALSFLASAIAILRIKKAEPPVPARATDGTKMRHEIAEGLRYVLGNRYLRWIAGCTATSNLFGAMLQAVFLVFAVRELGWSDGRIGGVLALSNIGVLAGAALAQPIIRRARLGAVIGNAILVSGLGVLLVALAPNSDAAAPLVAVGFGLMGAGGVVYNVSQVSFRQTICPHRLQGRMNATMRFMVWGTLPIGSLIGGALGTWFGLRTTLVVAAIGGLLAYPWIRLSPVGGLVEMPEPPDDDEPDPPMGPPEVVTAAI